MHGHNLVAIYQSFADAERVRARLITDGVPATDIHLSPGAATATTTSATVREEQHQGFFEWLFGSDVPETDRSYYDSHLQGGRAALSVRVTDETRSERILDVMEEFGPLDIDDREIAATAPVAAIARTEARTDRVDQGEQVIPIVKEQLDVGKRETERRYRVRTYVIERPVEEQVTLRDERVTIERRPVTARAASGATIPQERDIEVIERHQEAVVGKRAETVEEVVVRKEVVERAETVQGTVRETKVEMDEEPAAATRSDWQVSKTAAAPGPAATRPAVTPAAPTARPAIPAAPTIPGTTPGSRKP